jgi:outer membrane protein OmpA-like peptidoglycan-associated protein
MAQRLDWPRYSRWTWIIAILALIVLIWLWMTGRGPGSAASCCGAAPIAAAPAAPVAVPVAPTTPAPPAASSPVAHKAMWDGNKLTLEGQVPDAAAKKAIVDAAAAKYGADNVIDKLSIDAAAKGALTVTLLGTVASEAVKAARGDEAKAFYTNATIDNQLTVAAAPAAKAEDVQCGDSVVVAATFATGKADLTADARKLLDAVVPCIKGPYEVGGHTDNVGKDDSNQALSETRAASVAKYLATKGVDAKLLTPKGYGPTQPIGDNGTPEGKAKNRRIEFKKM